MIHALFIGFFLPASLMSQAGKIVFTATASKKEVVEGAQVNITWQVSGSIEGKLKMPDFGAFRMAGGTQEMSGMQFVNGTVQAQHSWVVSLMAPAPGEYTIPEATFTLKGNTYKSNPVQIKVVAAGTARSGNTPGIPSGGDPNIFLATELSHSKAYPGQQVICTVNIYTRYGLSGADLVALPKPSRGAITELERFDTPVEQVTLGGKLYNKQAVFAGAFFPDASGRITISAAQMNVAIQPANIIQPIQTLRLQSEPVALDVRALPAPAPEGFTGLVGQYTPELKVDRDSVAEGEAVIALLRIRGNGNARLLAPPGFRLPEGLTCFDPVVKEEENFENGRELVHSQTLEYVISARKSGDWTCVPVFVWFDPDSSKYITWSPELHIKTSGQSSQDGSNALLPNGSEGSRFTLSNSQLIGLGALGLAGALGLFYFLWMRRRKPEAEEEETPSWQSILKEQSPILPPSQPEVIVEHISVPPPAEPPAPVATFTPPPTTNQHDFYEVLYAQLRAAFANRLNITPEQVTQVNASAWMTSKGLSEALIADMRLLWRTCEQVLYAAQDHAAEMEEMAEMGKRVMGVVRGA